MSRKSTISGEKVTLKRTVIEHAGILYPLMDNPNVTGNLTVDFSNIEDFRRYLIYTQNQWQMHQNYAYTIFTKENAAIGQVSLYNLSFNNRKAEIGIWIGEKYWNKGYGSDSINIIIEYAFKSLNLFRLQAHVFTFNNRSVELFEHFGFQYEGLQKAYIWKNGAPLDVHALVKFANV